MVALDTNVIARFYVDDPSDPESAHQRPVARQLFEQSGALFVPRTVVLELEWVLRAFYGFGAAQFVRVIRHLASLPHVTMESAPLVLAAAADHADGLDFADALHLHASSHCSSLASFDDRRFARRATRLKRKPPVVIPG